MPWSMIMFIPRTTSSIGVTSSIEWQKTQSACEKTGFFGVFPMFVPSLSW